MASIELQQGEDSVVSNEKDGQEKQTAPESVPTTKESGFDPAAYQPRAPVQEPPSVTGNYPPITQMAVQATVDAQVQRLQQHINDSYRLAMSEIGRLEARLGGQIDLVRRDVNDCRSSAIMGHKRGYENRTVAGVV
jgi:hypothetical protein